MWSHEENEGSLSSITQVKSLYEPQTKAYIYTNPITSSSENPNGIEVKALPPLPPEENRQSSLSEVKYEHPRKPASNWTNKVILFALLLNFVILLAVGAIAAATINKIAKLQEDHYSIPTEMKLLQNEITVLREANKTCSAALHDLRDNIPTRQVPTPTPSGSTEIYKWVRAANGFEYLVGGEGTFFTANTTCVSMGAKMAVWGVRNTSIQLSLIANSGIPQGVSVWVGLDKLDEQGDWTWHDGVRATASNTNWAVGEPNNAGGADHCAYLDYWSKSIYDGWCDHTNSIRAFCERRSEDPQ